MTQAKRNATIVVLLAFTFIAGCKSINTEVAPLSEQVYDPLSADIPVQLTTGDLSKTYEELAVVTVWANRSLKTRNVLERLNELLREQARSLGADAVVRIDYMMQTGSGDTDLRQSATGTAVRTTSEPE